MSFSTPILTTSPEISADAIGANAKTAAKPDIAAASFMNTSRAKVLNPVGCCPFVIFAQADSTGSIGNVGEDMHR